jgi:hypothetical protein
MKYSRRHQAVCHRHFTSINSESKRKRIGLRDPIGLAMSPI